MLTVMYRTMKGQSKIYVAEPGQMPDKMKMQYRIIDVSETEKTLGEKKIRNTFRW